VCPNSDFIKTKLLKCFILDIFCHVHESPGAAFYQESYFHKNNDAGFFFVNFGIFLGFHLFENFLMFFFSFLKYKYIPLVA